MNMRITIANLPALLAATLLAVGCSEPVGPHSNLARRLAAATTGATGAGITLDQLNGSFGESGPVIVKGFNPTNPHNGDAIIATFFFSSSDTITAVNDYLTTTPYTLVGNAYTLVDFVTAGGISMATYVATNVQNFPDAYANPAGDSILAVQATFKAPIAAGGEFISAWSGVNTVAPQALGGHSYAVGSGSTATVADPGGVPLGAGALAYTVTMSNALVGTQEPAPPFTYLDEGSNALMKGNVDYAVSTAVSATDPQWTWLFTSQSTWLASVLALNPPLHLVFTVQPSTTLPLMAIQPPVKVTALDGFGNPVASFTGAVTVAIGHNGGMLMPGALSGTKTVTAVNGVATFSDLSIDQPGNGYTLVAASPSVTGAESAPFNIGAL